MNQGLCVDLAAKVDTYELSSHSAMRHATLSAIARLLLWGGLVLVAFAWNGSASAHSTNIQHPSVVSQVGTQHASDHDHGSGGLEHSQDQKCGHHGGCMQFAFPAVAGVHPLPRAAVQKPTEVTIQRRGALRPLDHPPKFEISL